MVRASAMTEERAAYGRARVVGVIQARVGSTRLPAKVLRPICGRPMIARIWERLCLARQLDDVLAAIPDTAENDILAAVLQRERIPFVRGPEERLATRLLLATEPQDSNLLAGHADAIVRITGDCPLIDPAVIDQAVLAWRENPTVEYMSNIWPAGARSWPEGLDCELMTRDLLHWLQNEFANDRRAEGSPSEWIWAYAAQVRLATVRHPLKPREDLHWSVDTAEDLEGARRVYERLPEGFGWREVIEVFGPLSLSEIGAGA